MFGKYTARAMGKISADRTQAAVELTRSTARRGRHVCHAGQHDLVMVVTFPDVPSAIKASVALSRQTGIAFTTAPAITVEEFDEMMEQG